MRHHYPLRHHHLNQQTLSDLREVRRHCRPHHRHPNQSTLRDPRGMRHHYYPHRRRLNHPTLSDPKEIHLHYRPHHRRPNQLTLRDPREMHLHYRLCHHHRNRSILSDQTGKHPKQGLTVQFAPQSREHSTDQENRRNHCQEMLQDRWGKHLANQVRNLDQNHFLGAIQRNQRWKRKFH